MTLQDESRADGRSIDPAANPNHTRCGGSGWYIRNYEIETCDCTVATHYVLFRAGVPNSPMVKEASFFKSQNGHLEEWGRAWEPIVAESIGDARRKIADRMGVTLSHIYMGEE